MSQFSRRGNTIYVGGTHFEWENCWGVNISSLGHSMCKEPHQYILVKCFGVEIIIFKGTEEFEMLYPKFMEWQNKIYDSYRDDRIDSEKVMMQAKEDMTIRAIEIGINYVKPKDIYDFIITTTNTSYAEGYEAHKTQLKNLLGF